MCQASSQEHGLLLTPSLLPGSQEPRGPMLVSKELVSSLLELVKWTACTVSLQQSARQPLPLSTADPIGDTCSAR